jgi:MYXO-CTERM domain-containing protein
MRTSRLVAVAVAVVAGLGWPSIVPEPTRVPPAPGLPPAGGADGSVDVAAVVERVHYAFRPDGGAWRAGHATHAVALKEGGLLELRPGGPGGGPVRLAPAGVARGGALLAEGEGVTTIGDRGQLELARGALVETLRNGPAGVEQSWRFPDRPPGRDDLEVRIALAAGRFVGESEAGLHFTGGAQGVRYGHATWIDAAGIATPVASRWDGSAIVLRVPADVVDRSIYPAVLDPVIGPELSVDVPIYQPAMGDQWTASVACGGTSCLAVWADGRWSYGLSSEKVIYGARIATDGSVLDPDGIPIAMNTSAGSPVAAWDGTNWLVAWTAVGLTTADDIYAARVRGSDGAVLDPDGIALSVAPGAQITPAVSCSGAACLVVWADARGGAGYDIYGARVRSSDGALLDPSGIAISTFPGDQLWPRLVWTASSFLVVWGDRRSTSRWEIYGARVSGTDGSVLDPVGIAISLAGDSESPAVAWDGTNALVVWEDRRSGTSSDLYAARVRGSDGTVLDPSGKPLWTAATDQLSPDVAWDGTRYLVAWSDNQSAGLDLFCVRVSPTDLTVIGASADFISTEPHNQYFPKVAWNGTHFLVVWVDDRSGAGTDVYAARVSGTDGSVPDWAGTLVSSYRVGQFTPVVAWDGTNYLVVWTVYRALSGADLMAARIRGSDGALLDPAGIAISSVYGEQIQPAVAWDGTEFLVVWTDHRSAPGYGYDIYGARVRGSDGYVLGNVIPISTADGDQTQPAVAADGGEFMVVWLDRRHGPSADIYGARVRGSDGALLDPIGIPISTAANDQSAPAVAAHGGFALVVWQDGRDGLADTIHGARVRTADGFVVEEAGIALSTPGVGQALPAVATDGTTFLVAWVDGRGGIYGTRVRRTDGSVLDAAGILVSTTTGSGQIQPKVAWDGSNYVLAWSDGAIGAPLNLYGARVSPEGAAGIGAGFAIGAAQQSERLGGLAAVGPGEVLVVYQRDPGRIYTRRIDTSNRAPVLLGGASVTTPEDVAVDIPLSATDPDGDALGWVVVTPPAHGTVTGSAPTYTPAADFNGSDAFVIAATDGLLRSTTATVNVTVTPVNDPPVAQDRSVTTHRANPVAVTLLATDVDGDPLTYAVVTPPVAGTLTGTPPTLTYTAHATFASGTDTFTYRASDGTAASNLATVTVTVTNGAPVASDQAVSATGGTPQAITLAASDPDGDALEYNVVAPPAHGSLSASGATRTYSPAAGFSGTDAFTFSASDGALDSNVATVTITVAAAPAQPSSGGCGCSTGGDAAPAGLLLLALLALLPRRRGHRTHRASW